MPSKFAAENDNVFQLLGNDFVPQTPYRGSPRIPLGDFRPRGVVPLRHLRVEARAPQTVLRLWLIVYRTELTVSLCA